MPTIEEIKNQMKDTNVTDTFGTKKEIKFLPQVLHEDEKIKYMTSGLLDGTTWLIVCTNKRIIFLDKGLLYGLKQQEIPLEKINSIGQKQGLILGSVEIWDGASKMKIDNITKKTIKPFVDAVNAAKENLKIKDSTNLNNTSNDATDIPQQIKKLAELKQNGILTEDEFNAKKTELLAKM
ncbi:PH domain-containing protein [Clostridium akagii]|uniref:PH domain-containing protein n=1 Tax=Clostridium akagii TaxID=91623 RepID=UPI000479AD8E|nr:PH domain-containing protein [Clostridium akagii]